MLLQQNRDLQMAILSIKEESYRRRSEEMRKRLARMKPITGALKMILTPCHEKRSILNNPAFLRILYNNLKNTVKCGMPAQKT